MKKEQPMWMEKLIYSQLLLLFFWLPASLNGQIKPEDNYLRGRALLQQEKYDSALIAFTLSKGFNEKDARTWYYSGLANFYQNRNKEAIADFTEAEKLDPGIATFMLSKAWARENRIDKTLEYLEIHLNSRDKKPESTILLDKDLSQFENRREWIEFWKKNEFYSTFDKTLAEASYLLKNEDYLEAIDVIQAGIDRGFRNSPLMAKRAEIYIEMGNDDLALKDLNEAIEGDRRNPHLFIARGNANYRLENYRRSLEDFDRALRLEPDNLNIYPLRALAYSKSGMYEEASKDMNYFIQYFPEDDKAWYNFGKIHMEDGKYLNALRSLNRALEINKTRPTYYIARGESYYHARTYRYASNDLSMALDLDPRNAEAYFLKGLTEIKLGNNDMACFCLERAYQYGKKEAFDYLGQYCR